MGEGGGAGDGQRRVKKMCCLMRIPAQDGLIARKSQKNFLRKLCSSDIIETEAHHIGLSLGGIIFSALCFIQFSF